MTSIWGGGKGGWKPTWLTRAKGLYLLAHLSTAFSKEAAKCWQTSWRRIRCQPLWLTSWLTISLALAGEDTARWGGWELSHGVCNSRGSSSSGRWGRTGFVSLFDPSFSLLLGVFPSLHVPTAPSKALLHARTFGSVPRPCPTPTHLPQVTFLWGPALCQADWFISWSLWCGLGKPSLPLGNALRI